MKYVPLYEAVCSPYWNTHGRRMHFRLKSDVNVAQVCAATKSSANLVRRYIEWMEPYQVVRMIKRNPKLMELIEAHQLTDELNKKQPSAAYLKSKLRKKGYR